MFIFQLRFIIQMDGYSIGLKIIDVYRRVLVNVFDLVERDSLNNTLLTKKSSKTGMPIAEHILVQ